MKVFTWNCNGLSNDKRTDIEFQKLVFSYDIVILSESWADKESFVNVSGYKCFNFYRKFRHPNARRNSGGILVYCKDSVVNGVSIIKNHCDTLIWLKLDKLFFNLDTDVYLCGVYVWSDGSPAAAVYDTDLFHVLQEDICFFSERGRVCVAGDWNARVSDKDDFIANDSNITDLDTIDYEPDINYIRTTQDKGFNSHGKKMLDLCKSSSMRIVNGRVGTDKNVGAYTYVCSNSCSTIDYLIMDMNSFDFLDSFSIGSFNQFSDHAPLIFSFKCNFKQISSEMQTSEETSIKWNNELCDIYRNAIIGKLSEINSIFNSYNGGSRHKEDIDLLVGQFSELICDVANPLFKKTRTVSKECTYMFESQYANSSWFDNECRYAKKEYKNALRQFNIEKSIENRANLVAAKKTFKSTTRRKRRQYSLRETKILENMKYLQPREFWSKFSSKRQNKSFNVSTSDFFEYFKSMFNEFSHNHVEEADTFVREYLNSSVTDNNLTNNENGDNVNSFLNDKITVQEIQSALKKLKCNKAGTPNDSLLNEYFIEAFDILGSHLVDLFNIVLDTGHFPTVWGEGYIVPLHKKGDTSKVENYRGITLTSSLGKLFTAILTNRLELFCELNKNLSDTQFGFRKGRSTIDAVFILNSLIERFFNDKCRLYCAFVD